MHKLQLYPVKLPDRKAFVAEIGWEEDEIRSERRRFTIETFANLKRDEDVWVKLRPVNEFLQTLDRDEAFYLVRLFVQAKRSIMGVNDRKSLINAITAIDEIVCKTFTRLNLSKRLQEFISKDREIAQPDFSSVGNGSQDTPEKTFYQPEYEEIRTIVVISKLLFPIYGEIIDRVINIEDSSNDTKEVMAFGILNSLLRTDFNTTIIKLNNYIDSLIKKSVGEDSMTTFRGMTQTSLTADRMAKMIVKSGVNFNLYREGGNIIKMLVVSLKRSVQNDSTGGGKKKVTYRELYVPEKGEDGRNISNMEHEAHVLKEPLEVPIMVELAVNHFIDSYIEQNNIRRDVFDRAVKYYKTTTLPPTIVNEWLIGLFVAGPIGSAYSVRYMNIDMFSKLATLIQIYAIRMGYGSIVPLTSMIPTGVKKMAADDVDNFMLTGGIVPGIINYYVHLKGQVIHLEKFTNFKFDDYLTNMTNLLIGYNHTFNVSPDILEIGSLGSSFEEDGMLKYGRDLINELYRFAYHILAQAPEDRKIINIGEG